MRKSDLINWLCAKNSNLRHQDIETLVTDFFLVIQSALANNLRVEVRGFGVFGVRQRKARMGRNPRTGELVNVAEKYVPYFKAGKDLREKINASSEWVS